MSIPPPESFFELLEDGIGYIGWHDGHSVGGETIQEAVDAGMRHFYTVQPEEDNFDFYVLCYRDKPKNSKVIKRDALKIYEEDEDEEDEE